MTNYRTPAHRRTMVTKGFEASFLQVRRAFEAFYGVPLFKHLEYRHAAGMLREDMGYETAKAFITGQSNSPEFLETDMLPYSNPVNLWKIQSSKSL